MKNYRLAYIVVFALSFFGLSAQNEVDTLMRISGYVVDAHSGMPIREAEIHVKDKSISTMTNEDGYFVLKCPKEVQVLSLSALGYHSMAFAVKTINADGNSTLRLTPSATILKDVLVYRAENIVEAALKKIEDNYPSRPMMYNTFYRETVKKRSRYVSVIEAVQDIYKRPYANPVPEQDRVYLLKGRRLLSEHRKDTIAVHVEGGPSEALYLDLVKNRDFFLNKDTLLGYEFWLENSKQIGERMQYVVGFHPIPYMTHEVEYSGLFYIDAQTLAFTRIELSLDCSDRQKATAFMLRHKPMRLRFRPESLVTVINYYYDGEKSHVSYIRNVFKFGCDWKKRGLYTHYVVTSENLVTRRQAAPEKAPGRSTFGKYDILDKKVGNFADPEFWKDYNIIEPSESLENAVRKLVKRVGE